MAYWLWKHIGQQSEPQVVLDIFQQIQLECFFPPHLLQQIL